MRDAGLIDDSEPLASDHQRFIDALSSDEIDALISIKSKLDELKIPWVPLTGHAPAALMPF
jgi:hypothetical protein